MINQNENIDEVDLKDILLVLEKRKKSIIYGVLIGTSLLISVLFFMPKTYQSNAVLSLNALINTSLGINIPTFRSLDNVYSNTNLFVDYLNSVDSNSDWHVEDNEFITNSAIPLYAYDKKSVISIDKNTVLGLKLTCLASSPERARGRVELLGNYIKTVMLNIQIWDYFDVAQAMAATALAKNNSSILQSKFEIENLQERSEMLESKVLGSEAIKFTFETQIIQVAEVTEKYLSPEQQLLSVKVSIKNSEIGVKSLERKIRKNQFMLDYFSRIEGYFDRRKQFLFDAELLDEITAELESFFSDHKNNDAADEAYYTIMEHFNEFFNMQHAQYKFISGPTMSKEWVKPKILITSVIGLMFFILFFSFGALLVEWWKSD